MRNGGVRGPLREILGENRTFIYNFPGSKGLEIIIKSKIFSTQTFMLKYANFHTRFGNLCEGGGAVELTHSYALIGL